MTLIFIVTGSLAFAGIVARFASRSSRKATLPSPAK
jgi:hypothetical protein